jgi:hypothetical protein
MLLVVLDELKLHRRTLSSSPSQRKKGSPSLALLRSPPPPKIPLGECIIPRHPRRARPHRRRLAIAPGPPRRSSGRGATAPCIMSPPSPTGATVSRPHLDRRPRIEREIPLRIFNLSRRSENQRLSFNESPWTRGPPPWTWSTDHGPIPPVFQ